MHDNRLYASAFCWVPPDQCDRTAANSSTLPLSWSGVAQRSAHQRASILGKLGGHVAHDPPTTSYRGGGNVLLVELSS